MTHGSLVRGGLLVLLLSGGRAEVIGNMNAPVRPRWLDLKPLLRATVCSAVQERPTVRRSEHADDAKSRATVAPMTRFFRVLQRLLPERLGAVPAYQDAMQRIAGKTEPGARVTVVNRVMLGRARLVLRAGAAIRSAGRGRGRRPLVHP